MTREERIVAAQAAIRAFREEREQRIKNEKNPVTRIIAERASRDMHDFLRDTLSVYRGTLDRVDLERRQCGPHHPKLEELMSLWTLSEDYARDLFEHQLEEVRREFMAIFARNGRGKHVHRPHIKRR